ncbi:related to tRNA dihydrouridine synthase [Phialocephala subalpina]|uniref:Related to tRNA dihydrouridine synthase n=1 Tax=Phialocephala subalpina TaxID=576137 RepID=A0A1L7WCJ2_9HELO|nr:related to tRNA dihydrouridine synthase [Phialocephala subalpina]
MQRFMSTVMTSVTKRVPIPPKGVDYRGKIVLAPMVRSGELPSRLLALHYGADLVWGPETVDRSMIGTTRKVNSSLSTIDFTRLPSHGSKDPGKDQPESLIYRIYPAREGRRLIFQIGTSDPERAVQAARIVAGDVAGIDVNAGCPKPFSTSGGMGAALLQTPDKLCSILEALVKEIVPEFEIGISVKIRLLETPEKTECLVKKLCATGITGLTIHCRTTPMRPRERAIREQLRMIADICKENGVACLMNGDVENRAQAEQLIAEYGVDGAMIATAAESNSSCFRSEADGGLAPWKEVVEQYIKTCLEVENRWGNTKYLCNHLIPGKRPEYREVTTSRSYHQLCKILGFEHLESQAKEVDEKLGIFPDAENQGRRGKKNKSAVAAGGGKTKQEKKKPLSERGVQSQPAIDPSTLELPTMDQPAVAMSA